MLIGLVASSACFILIAALRPRQFGSAQARQAGYAVLPFPPGCGILLFTLLYVGLSKPNTRNAYLNRVSSTMRLPTLAAAALVAPRAKRAGERFDIRAAQLCVAVASMLLSTGIRSRRCHARGLAAPGRATLPHSPSASR